MRYTVSIDVAVFDPDALLATAKTYLQRDQCTTIDELLRHADGTIDVGECLIAIFDPGESPPGVEIERTSAMEDVD